MKKIVIVLTALTTLYFIVCLFLPSSVIVERKLDIHAEKSHVFNQVNHLPNWEKWSPWHRLDPKMKLSYSTNPTGKDAWYEWESEQSNVGAGKLIIVGSFNDDSIQTQMIFKGQDEASGQFNFTKTASGSTEVTWKMKASFPFYARIFGLMMDNMIGKDFEAGLKNLDSVALHTPPMIPELKYETIEQAAKTYIAIRDSAGPMEISKKFETHFTSLVTFAQKQNIPIIGAPCAMFYKNNPEMMEFECMLPVTTAPAKLNEPIHSISTPAGKIVNYAYFGDYAKMFVVYEQLMHNLAAKHIVSNGYIVEEYITDPMIEKDTAKWQTNIQIPIKE